MHDPDVVAFTIRRPWPQRSSPVRKGVRWSFGRHRNVSWWKPRAWSPFWVLAGQTFYFPSLVTVWHHEPGGRDSGEVCKHYRRDETIDGWKTTHLHGWKWHVHHWHVQVPALQALRRRLLTRCEWCGGPSLKGDPVNVSHGWHGDRGPWWRGERGLSHMDCSGIPTAKTQCLCDQPMVLNGSTFGDCLGCGKRRYGSIEPHHLAIRRLYATVPDGQRPSLDLLRQVEALAEPHTVRSPRLRNAVPADPDDTEPAMELG